MSFGRMWRQFVNKQMNDFNSHKHYTVVYDIEEKNGGGNIHTGYGTIKSTIPPPEDEVLIKRFIVQLKGELADKGCQSGRPDENGGFQVMDRVNRRMLYYSNFRRE